MLKSLLTILGLFTCLTGFSQPTYEWTNVTAGDGEDFGRHVRIAGNGDVFETGYYSDTVDLDPGPGVLTYISGGYVDTYIKRLNPNGDLVWVKPLTSTLAVEVHGLQVDSDDNLYISGSYRGNADFDPGAGVDAHTAAGPRDIFVVKLDSSGGFIWAKTLGGPGFERCYGLDIDSERSVYVGGYFADSVDFDPGPGFSNQQSGGEKDAYVLKLDSIGDFSWVVTYPNDTLSFVQYIEVDQNDDVLVSGFYAHTMDFDPGPAVDNRAANGMKDLFLTKLDKNGNKLWAITEGGIDDDIARGIAVDLNNNVYVTGSFAETVDFDPTTNVENHISNGLSDIFIQKFDASGSYLWTKTMGADSVDHGIGITVDTFNYVYITGAFMDTVDFDPGPSTYSIIGDTLIQNTYLLKMDQNGNYIWSTAIIGVLGSNGIVVQTNNADEIYVTGAFMGDTDFDYGPGTDIYNGDLDYRDAFLTKYTQCIPTASVLNPVACNSYTSPSGNYVWTSSGTYTDTLVNDNTCEEDSILYINLVIMNIDTTVSAIDQLTLEANGSGLQYQWLDCDNNYNPIAGETNQSFTASQNGNYAVQVSNGTCVDTSACMPINSVGLNELSTGLIRIYPNPSEGVFNLVFTDEVEVFTYSVQDIGGRIVKSEANITGKTSAIDLSKEPKGFYFLRVANGENSEVFKLILE